VRVTRAWRQAVGRGVFTYRTFWLHRSFAALHDYRS
jgi:hypothetical protein